MAQLLVGHNFKTTQKDSKQLHETSSQHELNHIVIFQSQWTINIDLSCS